jgi:hypothetical protein
MFFCVNASLAAVKSAIRPTPAASARSSPYVFGTSALYRGPGGSSGHSSAASASWGTHLGETKLVASISVSPLAASADMNAAFAAVGTGTGSFCSPSLGPTSMIRTTLGF